VTNGWGKAESVQFLIDNGHAWSEIEKYPPQLFGRMVVACVRLEEQRHKKWARANWASTHLNQEGLKKYLEATSSKRSNDEEITPEQSRKAAIGLMHALSGR
jgi:hypothetical protein